MTRNEAIGIMRARGWDSTKLLGFAWIVGPSRDGMIEGVGQGKTLELAVLNALDAEQGAKP